MQSKMSMNSHSKRHQDMVGHRQLSHKQVKVVNLKTAMQAKCSE